MRSGLYTLALGLWLACSASAEAQVQVQMSANRSELNLGENVVVHISVQTQGTESPEMKLPEFEGFQIVQRSVQRPMQFSFGFGQGAPVVTSSTDYTFVLVPVAAGHFRFAPVRVTLGQRTYQSQPLVLTVHGAAKPQPEPDQQPQGASGARPGVPAAPAAQTPAPQAAGDVAVFDNDAFLRTVVDKNEPYEGEQVTVTMYLYTRRNLQQTPEVRSEPSTDGFWTHDLLSAGHGIEPTRQIVNGRGFWVYALKRFAAFPLKSGELTIGAMTLRLSRETIFDIFDPSRAEPTLTRTGVPVLLHVKPLPAEGKPQGDVAVGSFELTAHLDRSQAATGDALTLTATVRGKGNVGGLRLKDPVVPGLDVLQPETHEVIESPGDLVQGTRTFAWLIVPRAPGSYQIPALALDLFDPADHAYHHVQSAPVTLTAAGNARPETVAAAATEQGTEHEAAPQDKASEENWAPIRTRSALLRKSSELDAAPFYPWALAFGPFLWVLSISVPALRRRVQQKRAQGGPREALRNARKQLTAAASAVREKDGRRLHAEIAAALHLALDARLGVTVLGLTRPQLRSLLDARGLPDAESRELLDVLERCDFARFSSAAVSEAEMQEVLGRANQVFEGLQRFAPKEAA